MEPEAFVGDRWVPLRAAALPIWDLGWSQGIAVVEQLRTCAGRLWRLDRHLDRLERGLQLSGIGWPRSRSEVAALARDAVARNLPFAGEDGELSLSLVITPGAQAALEPAAFASLPQSAHWTVDERTQIEHFPTAAASPAAPTLVLQAFPLKLDRWQSAMRDGLNLSLVATREIPGACVPREIKNRNRLHYWLASRQAQSIDGPSEPLLLDIRGKVAESPTATVVLVSRSAELVVPGAGDILPGITLEFVIEHASQIGLSVQRRSIEPVELYLAEEIWWLSTPVFMLPVRSLNGYRLRSAALPGPWFRRMHGALEQAIGGPIWKKGTGVFSAQDPTDSSPAHPSRP